MRYSGSCAVPNLRRQLNHTNRLIDAARDRGIGTVKTRLNDPEQAPVVLAALFDLDVPCKNPACLHELGFHTYRTPALAAACGFTGCTCSDFQRESPTMLNPHDPFAGMAGEPDAPEPTPLTGAQFLTGGQFVEALGEPETPVEAMTSMRELAGAFGGPVGASDPDEAVTPVRFPVLVRGAESVNLADLSDPARRVAEIVEALEPVLAPPPVVRDLEALVTKANALQIVDADSYATGCELYELLAANEKGVEESIGPVVAFFHRPWKALCEFRARFAKPVAEAKKRLSDDCGAWKLAADNAAEAQARRDSEAAAEAERLRLTEIAEAATAAAAATPAGSPVREVLEQTAAQATEQSTHVLPMPLGRTKAATPATTTNGRKTYIAALAITADQDQAAAEDAFYKALLEDRTRRIAAPIDWAYLNRQAKDLGEELGNRFPGIVAREKGGLSASGRR